MDVRRLYSSSLAETGSNGSIAAAGQQVEAPSPFGSPKANGTRLPSLWKNIKSKLVSLSTSKSATNLASLPMAVSTTAMAPTPVESSLAARSAVHPNANNSQRLFAPVDCGFSGRSASGGVPLVTSCSASKASTCTTEASAGSSPVAIEKSTSVLSTESDGVPEQPLSPARNSPPKATAVHSHLERSSEGEVPSQAPASKTKLLAMSPALPAAMYRSIWSLDDYVISKRLFKGTSSAVYKAVCRRSGLPVALKVYFLARVPINVVHMLKREIEIHSQLVHKHVVRLYGAFMDDGERVVLVQEFASQGDLYGILQRLGGRMLPDQVSHLVVRPFLDALAYLHSRGICHRDIKPENILFTGSWRLLMADFGVSIDLNQERAVTRAGTEGYMAPEVERCPLKAQPHDNKDDPRYAYSTAVDIWAVGVLAYELMVGFPPVVAPPGSSSASAAGPSGGGGGDVSGFVRCHMTASELHFPASVPAAARSFISAALSSDPLDRPTAAQLLQHPWLRPPPQPPQVQQPQQQVGAAGAPVPGVQVQVPDMARGSLTRDLGEQPAAGAAPTQRPSATLLFGSAPAATARLCN